MFTQEEINKLLELITIHQSKLAFDGKDKDVEIYENTKNKLVQILRAPQGFNIRF